MKKVFATIAIIWLIAAVASLAQLPKPGSGGGGGSGTTYTFSAPLNESGGTVTCATCARGMVLLETETASASAALDLTTCISATYDEYQIEILNLIPGTNGVALNLLVSTDGGSNFITSASYGWATFIWRAGATALAGAESGATAIQLSNSTNIPDTSTGGVVGTLNIFSPLSTALHTRIRGQLFFFESSGLQLALENSGVYLDTAAVNAVRFAMSTGSISSGTVRCYGIAK